MNKINFSDLGGFPGTQKTLKFMQDAYTDATAMLLADVGLNPAILSGMVVTGTTISDGWCMLNGDRLRFVGGTISATANNNYILKYEDVENVDFQDASTHPGYIGVTASVFIDPLGGASVPLGTPRLSDFKPYMAYSRSVESIAVATSNFAGTIRAAKDKVTGIVNLSGSITNSSAQGIASPAIYYVMSTLASTYRPLAQVPFSAMHRVHGVLPPKEVNNVDFIRHINGEMNTNGTFSLNWLRPEAGVTTYTVVFNLTYPTW